MDYDLFDYRSSHDSSYYDDLIDQYEHYQSFKCKKTKQRQRQRAHCAVPMKTLKSNSYTVRLHCFADEKTPKAKPKRYRYDISDLRSAACDCDQLYETQNDRVTLSSSSQQQPQEWECAARNLQIDATTDFPAFRRDFYRSTHRFIKSSCANEAQVKLMNIRPASIDPFVQDAFMDTLRREPLNKPYIVFHGTALGNFESILRFGLLIPNHPHPGNPMAPIIKVQHGQSFGVGIYSSLTPGYTMSYNRDTNTILACAAVPHQTKNGHIARRHGNILVLPSESRIIPLFLVDFTRTSGGTNYPFYVSPKETFAKRPRQVAVKPKHVTRKYLRKILEYINDSSKNSDRYQIRSFEM